MQQYQVTCRTATNKITTYLSLDDYPKVEYLINNTIEVGEVLFSTIGKEVSLYEALYKMQIDNTNIDPSDKKYKHIQKEIRNTNKILVLQYATEYQKLLKNKGSTFYIIYKNINKNANSLFNFNFRNPYDKLTLEEISKITKQYKERKFDSPHQNDNI